MKTVFSSLILSSIALFGLSCLGVQVDDSVELHNEQSLRLEQLREWMTGSFSSAAQAQADTNYYDISLNMCLLNEEPGEWFELYVEQALSSRMDQPYRQRIYRVAATDSVSFVSEIFEIEGNEHIVGACGVDSLTTMLKSFDRNLKTGCAVNLRWDGELFRGSTKGNECLNSFGGATYATSEVKIFEGGIESWDQGFDAEDVKVWGPDVTGYTFLRK